MAGLTPYKGLEVLASSPIPGEGGRAINDNFVKLVDWDPKSNWSATTYPQQDDDSSEDYQIGSKWFTPDLGLFICVDDTVGAAVWHGLNVGTIGVNVGVTSIGGGRHVLLLPSGGLITVPENTAWAFSATALAMKGSSVSSWVVSGVVFRATSNASIVGSNVTATWSNFSGDLPGFQIDTTGSSLRLAGFGVSGATITWTANLRIVQLNG